MPGTKPGMMLRGTSMIKKEDVVGVYRRVGFEVVDATADR
jgi:hypothetical protein